MSFWVAWRLAMSNRPPQASQVRPTFWREPQYGQRMTDASDIRGYQVVVSRIETLLFRTISGANPRARAESTEGWDSTILPHREPLLLNSHAFALVARPTTFRSRLARSVVRLARSVVRLARSVFRLARSVFRLARSVHPPPRFERNDRAHRTTRRPHPRLRHA